MKKIRIRAKWILLLALVVCCAGAAKVKQSEWVHYGWGGKLVYKKTSSGDRIMDFSTAGYMGGGVGLPTAIIRETVEPSGGDDTPQIQAAVNRVGALPLINGLRGAVVLAPGNFICSNTIYL